MLAARLSVKGEPDDDPFIIAFGLVAIALALRMASRFCRESRRRSCSSESDDSLLDSSASPLMLTAT